MKLLLAIIVSILLSLGLCGCQDAKVPTNNLADISYKTDQIPNNDKEDKSYSQCRTEIDDTQKTVITQDNLDEILYGKWVLKDCMLYGADLSGERFKTEYYGKQIEIEPDLIVINQIIKGVTYKSKEVDAREFFESFNWYSYDESEMLKGNKTISIIEIEIEKHGYKIPPVYLIQGKVCTVDTGSIFVYERVENDNSLELEPQDFTINNGGKQITLGESYDELELTEQEESNVVATNEVINGKEETVYNVNVFNMKLVLSNKSEAINKSKENIFIVTQIVLPEATYTARGIKKGATLEEVKQTYGEGFCIMSEGHRTLKYILGDQCIDFHFDSDGKVNMIFLEIISKEREKYIKENARIIKEGKVYTHPTLNFQIIIPKSWDEKYIIKENNTSVEFLHKIEQGEGSNIYLISVFESLEEWQGTEQYMYTYLGTYKDKVYVKQNFECTYDINTEEGAIMAKEIDRLRSELRLEDNFEFIS